jgi:hypothetical protein
MRHVRWSDHPDKRAEGMDFKKHQWLLVHDFVQRFNSHRAANIQPSELICVDESMLRRYGNGGDWINSGIPQYIATINRKPENRGEIQDASCGKSGIMLQLKLVKGADADRESHESKEETLHGAKVLYDLVSPWRNSHWIVCADSYFASVPAALLLWRHGLRFIGVIKTATKQYPFKYLHNKVWRERGDAYGLIRKKNNNKECDLLAFVWVDQGRRYFVATSSSLEAGTPMQRRRDTVR